jgi:hypothetical protein
LAGLGYTTGVVDIDTASAGVSDALSCLIVRVPDERLLEAIEIVDREPRIVHVVVRIAGDPTSGAPTGDRLASALAIHRLYARKVTLSVDMRFDGPPPPESLDRRLAQVEGLPLEGVTCHAAGKVIREGEEDSYVGAILAHRELFRRVRVQIHFLPSFRPTRCEYLEIDRPIAVLRDGWLSLCPCHAGGNSGSHNSIKRSLYDEIERMGMIARRIREARLEKYAWQGRAFDCSACVGEGTAS